MHTLESELRTLRAEGIIDDATAGNALALDRGAVFSLQLELRATLYAGVLLVMAGAAAWWLGAAGRADVRKHPGRYSNEGALTAGMICGAIVTIGMAAMFALVLLALLLGAA